MNTNEYLKLYSEKMKEIEAAKAHIEELQKEANEINKHLNVCELYDYVSRGISLAKKNRDEGIYAKYFSESKIFTYQGHSFIEFIGKVLTKKELKIVENHMRGGSCILYASNGYDYEEFYAAMPGSRRRDLYLCLDDGKVYIPCSFQMMWVDNSVLKSIDLYEDYEEILAPNEFILHKCKEMVQEQDISSWSKTQRINTITYFDLEGEIEEGKEFPIKKVITKPLTSENFNKFLELYN